MMIFQYLIILFYSLWIGGLFTTIYNRIPNDIPIGPNHKPRCNNCGWKISHLYFFPVIGYVVSKGKCMSCQIKIPKEYLLIELIVSTLILILFHFNDRIIDDLFVIKSLLVAYLIILGFIYNHHKEFKKSLVYTLILGIQLHFVYNGVIPELFNLLYTIFVSFLSTWLLIKSEIISCRRIQILIIALLSIGNFIHLYSFLLLCLTLLIFLKYKIFPKYIKSKIEHILVITLLIESLLIVIFGNSFPLANY